VSQSDYCRQFFKGGAYWDSHTYLSAEALVSGNDQGLSAEALVSGNQLALLPESFHRLALLATLHSRNGRTPATSWRRCRRASAG
jgi:hypothetical protein